MASRGLRITAWVIGTLVVLPILFVFALSLRPEWVERPLEHSIRNYLQNNSLSDSAKIEFESVKWIPFRGLAVRGLHLHRSGEGIYLKELQVRGLWWRDGGPAAESVVLDSLVVTGMPGTDWVGWFDSWRDPRDTASQPVHVMVDQAEVHFWMRSLDGDTVLAPSTVALSGIRLATDGLSLDSDMKLVVPGGAQVAVRAQVQPTESVVELAYEDFRLWINYQSDKIKLLLEEDSINSINLNVLNNNNTWVVEPTILAWNGIEGLLSAEWGRDVQQLNLQWSGIRAKIQGRQELWSLRVDADSAKFAPNHQWALHGAIQGTYLDSKWNLTSQSLRLRTGGARWRLGPLNASGTANSWKLDVSEAKVGVLSANGDYAGLKVRGTWTAREPVKPLEGLPSLASVDFAWSNTNPWNLQMVLRNSTTALGSASASLNNGEWLISGSFDGYRLRALFDRTPDQWSIQSYAMNVLAEQVVSKQLDVLDSIGLKNLSINGPELNAELCHQKAKTMASAAYSSNGVEAEWRYEATPSSAEHNLTFKGSENASLHLKGGLRDSLRVSFSGLADHPRGGKADIKLTIWPHRSMWWGRLASGTAAAWYRPELGLSLNLEGGLSGGQGLTYSFDSKRLAILDPLRWNSPEGDLAFWGVLSPDEGEVLRVQARNFNLPFWSRVSGLTGVDLGGHVRLDAVLIGQLNGWAVSGGIQTENFSIQNQQAGAIAIDLDYAPDAKRTALGVHWVHRDTVLLNLNGSLDDQNFAAQTAVLNIPIRWVRPFAEGALNGLNGRLKGSVQLESRADFSDLTWSGSGFWSNASLEIPSIGIGLRSNTPWTLNTKELVLGPARWADHKGVGSAEIRAKVSLTGAELLDLTFKTEKMVVLDLPPNPNFYGYVIGSGQGRLRGTASALRLDVKAKSSDSSVFVMPLDAPVSLDEIEFLHFKSRSTPDSPRARTRSADGFRFDLHLDLEVTPDVLARLILDETVGDVIEARGSGPLQLDLPWVGDMALRGNLVLNRGTYLFTLQNLINKPFSLLPGGTLNWTGDPYAAQMDLTAVYKTRADLRDYLSLPESGRQNVDVDLHATGPLFQPQLAFGIRLPNSGELAQAALQSRLSYPDERTTQVLSLLTISSFWVGSSPLSAQGMQAVESNTTQVLASQFTNFVTQGLGADWDVNLAYSTNTAAAQREMEASIGRRFLDDRLSIQTEWGIPIGQSQPSIGLGDVEVRYQLSGDGRWSAKAYQRRNDQNMQTGVVGSQRQGVGIRWEQSGDSWKDVLRLKNQ